jgi:hypothetical protein
VRNLSLKGIEAVMVRNHQSLERKVFQRLSYNQWKSFTTDPHQVFSVVSRREVKASIKEATKEKHEILELEGGLVVDIG